MPKIAIEANELTEVQVSHISLVKRGANKVPFRLLKSDGGTEMIQFKNIGNVFKSDPKIPMVAAILVNKDADLDAVKARIEAAKFSVENQQDTDDATIFIQGEATEVPDGVILKMDGDIALVLANVQKAFEPMNLESTSFGEVFAQEGLVPGFRLAVEALSDTFHNVLAKAENPEALTADVSKIMGEFSTHIQTLAKAVPPDAFSLDFFKGDVKTKPVKKEGETDEEKLVREAAEQTASEAELKAAADADAVKAKALEDAGDDPVALAAIASAETAESNQAILMKAISDQGEKTTSALAVLGERVAVVESTSKDTSAALKKTAASAIITGDEDPKKTVAKGSYDEDKVIPLLDTAYDKSLTRKAIPEARQSA